MPIYEYRCDACGECIEVLRKSGDKKLPTCPKCRAVMRKILSSSAIQFKGSGWYVTDYARKSGPAGKDKRAGDEKKEPAKKTENPPSD